MLGKNNETRLIVHIGMNKTGSSAIQEFFGKNFVSLRQNGVLFPRTGREKHKQHLILSNALGFQSNPREGPAGKRQLASLRAALDAEIATFRPHTVVVSSENFSRNRPLTGVVNFFSGYSVEILVYLRRHDHWLASRYFQALKMVSTPPWREGIDSFIKFHLERGSRRGVHESFAKLVDTWAAAFGPAKVLIRPYEQVQNTPDLIADMLDTIGTGRKIHALQTEDVRYNEGISATGCSRIENIQRSAISKSIKNMRINSIIAEDRKVKDSPRGADMIAPALRRQLVEENLDDYSYIARRYLGRDDGRLFFEPLPGTVERR